MSIPIAVAQAGRASLDPTASLPGQQPEAPESTSAASPVPVRKRRRVVNSCAGCRKRRSRCDRGQPCSECVSNATLDSCQYLDEAIKSQGQPSQLPVSVSNAPLRTLEQNVPALDQNLAARVAQLENLLRGQMSLLGPAAQLPVSRQTLSPSDPLTPPETTSGPSELFSHVRFNPIPKSSGYLRGKNGSETKFISARHWTSLLRLFPELRLLKSFPSDNQSPLFQAMSHSLNQFRHRVPSLRSLPLHDLVPSLSIEVSLRALLPPKQVAKVLVELYMGTLEKLHRIVHIGAFLHQMEYFWKAPASGDLNWTATMIVVLRLGLLVQSRYEDLSLRGPSEWIHRMETQSLQLVELYLHFTACTERPSLAYLQIRALLVVARIMDGSKPNVPWKLVGDLVQTGKFMGLDQEPSLFPHNISAHDAEVRRRLWTTILELYVHVSRTSCLPSIIDDTTYTIQRPVNINDASFIPCSPDVPVVPENWNRITDSTFQHVLSGSLGLRLQLMANNIPNIINGKPMAGEHCVECQLRKVLRPIQSPFDLPENMIQNTGGHSLQRVCLEMTDSSSFLYSALLSFPNLTTHSKQLLYDCCQNILRLHQDPELDCSRRFIVARWFRNDIITSVIVLSLAIRASGHGALELLLPCQIDMDEQPEIIQLIEGSLTLFAHPWQLVWKEIEEQDLLIMILSIVRSNGSIDGFTGHLEANMQKFEVHIPDDNPDNCSALHTQAQNIGSVASNEVIFDLSESNPAGTMGFANESNEMNLGYNFDTFMSDFGLDVNF